MHPFSFLFSPAAQALGHALLYSIWQAFIVVICLRLLLKLLSNGSSGIKYVMLYIAYMGIAVWFIITLVQQLPVAGNHLVNHEVTGLTTVQQTGFSPADPGTDSSFFSFAILNNFSPWIVGFYLAGIIWFAMKLLLNYFQTRQLTSKGLVELGPEWQERIRQLMRKLNIRQAVAAYYSRYIDSPVMTGFFKPVILLPLATMNHLTVQQFEAVLLHELAHIRRNDFLLNLIQSVADTLLFFNPFTWWITKKLREEREKCCDEMVLELSDPYHYAHALLALEEPVKNPSLMLTASGTRPQLLHRIKNIMEMKNNPINLRQKLVALLVIVVATISVAWLTPIEKERVPADRQTLAPEKSAASPLFMMSIFPARSALDTFPGKAPLTPQPPMIPCTPVLPAPPLPPAAPPLPPVPPVLNGGMESGPALPPLPPLPPETGINDSLPPVSQYFNSKEWKKQQQAFRKSMKQFQGKAFKKQQAEIRKSAESMKKYFDSPEWKKQQEAIQKSTAGMQKYFQSDAFKKQQAEIRKSAESMKKYFDSPGWKKQQEDIQKSGDKIQQYFNSPGWKKQQEDIQKSGDKIQQYFNSPGWKKQQEDFGHIADSVSDYFKGDSWKKQQEEFKKMEKQNKEPVKKEMNKK